MSRRPPRSPAEPRPVDRGARSAIDDPPTDRVDDLDRPIGGGDVPGGADDTALLGAYALGALTPQERAAVEERLAASPALQDELRRLIPVAALLREATDAPPSAAVAPDPSVDAAAGAPARPSPRVASTPRRDPEPPPEVRVAATGAPGVVPVPASVVPAPASTDGPPPPVPMIDEPTDHAPAADAPVDDEAPSVVRVEAAPGSLASQPGGRRPRAAQVAVPARPRPARTSAGIRGWPLSWVAAGLATLVAVGAVLWALALVDRLDTRRKEIVALETELGEQRVRGNAAVVALAPVEGGPAEADGVVVVVPTEEALIVRVTGVPASADDRVYQVWFGDEVEGQDGGWIVGPVFRVGESGTALVELPASTPDFSRLAISDEPTPGEDAPTGAFLLEGTVTAAEGE